MSFALRLIVAWWLPSLLFAGYGLARLAGIRGETDLVGISAVLRIVVLSFAASVAYLVSLLSSHDPFRGRLRPGFWRQLAACSMLMLIDDAFMLHEQLGVYWKIQDSIPLLAHGLWLLLILACHYQRLVPDFKGCILGFGCLGILAVMGDALSGREGTTFIGGFELDYEQIAELLAVTILASGICLQAKAELLAALRSQSELPGSLSAFLRGPGTGEGQSRANSA